MHRLSMKEALRAAALSFGLVAAPVLAGAGQAGDYIAPADDGTYPRVPDSSFPFDGANLDQPFDADFIDRAARERRFPPLPSRLSFSDR